MAKGFVVLLILGVALRGAADEQVGVASATSRTKLGNSWVPDNVLDGNTATSYHSDYSPQEQSLKLELTEPQDVAKVIIINRLDITIYITNRLLGTKISLVGAKTCTCKRVLHTLGISNTTSSFHQTFSWTPRNVTSSWFRHYSNFRFRAPLTLNLT
eukprot:sb/3473133/